MTFDEFKTELVKLGFIFDPHDFSCRRDDGYRVETIASVEALEDICSIYSDEVQKLILTNWRKLRGSQFNIKNSEDSVEVQFIDSNDGTLFESKMFKVSEAFRDGRTTLWNKPAK
jgi:hypothetical protein